jgi:O-antigen ligase
MRKLFYWSLFIFAFTIPISEDLSAKIIVLVFLISIILSVWRKTSIFSALGKSWDIIAYLVILILGLIHTEDIKTGIRVLETSLSLLGLLFIFSRIEDEASELNHNIIVSFMLGLLVASLICLGNAAISYNQSRDFHVFFYYQLTQVISSHPTYLAYYLIFSITYIVYMLYYGIVKPNKKVWIPILIFFFSMLILTGGKTAYVSVLMIFSFFILKYLLEDITKEKKIVFSVIVILLISLFVFSSINSFDIEFSQQNDYWERSLLWESAILANPNPIVGVGTGDYKTALNAYYQSHGMVEFAKGSFNSHNQFIQVYFSNGLIGLMALVFLVGRPLYLSVRSQNTLGILLIFPFIIYGVTEVFLGRYQGVVFFALLHQIVIYQHYSTRSSFTLKEG